MRSSIASVALLFPFHTTSSEYTDEQTRVYHDWSECPEGKKVLQRHRIEGRGGRRRCKVCEEMATAL